MSWYDGEADWPEYPVQHPRPVVLRKTIRCARCSATAEIPGAGGFMVDGQIKLYRAGWRRDPDTGYDYCPGCAR